MSRIVAGCVVSAWTGWSSPANRPTPMLGTMVQTHPISERTLILDDETTHRPAEPKDPANAAGSGPGQDVGVYLLDAATPEERAEFERAAEALPDVRAEAVQLAPAAAALATVYELSPEQAPEAFDLAVQPSAALRGRILATAWAEARKPPATAPASPVAESAPSPAPILTATTPRPQGRVRGGMPAPGLAEPIPIRSRSWRTPWMAAAAMLVVAVGLALWALALQNKMDDQTREMHAQSTEIAQIRTNANASAYTLTATGDGPSQAGGTFFYSQKDQRAVLVLDKMPELSGNSVYQLWYISGSSAPSPGATFKPSANGPLLLQTTPGIPSFDVVALTKEPEGGSKAPTTPVLMTGTTKGAAG